MKRRFMTGMMSAMLLMGGMALPVNASDTKNLQVTYTQDESYVLSIPASAQGLALSTAQAVTTTVGVASVNLAPGNEIQIKITAGVDENGTV